MHLDRLGSLIQNGYLWCDQEVRRFEAIGTTIGMDRIKERRLTSSLTSHPDLNVGQCVPFYFCPRSIMLYIIHRGNDPEMTYLDGQSPIVHLEFDLYSAVSWVNSQGLRWAFTLSNAGSYFFEDRCNLAQLDEIDWEAVQARNWRSCKEGKQAEFLAERYFPWALVERIGVYNTTAYQQTSNIITSGAHRPSLEIKAEWYY